MLRFNLLVWIAAFASPLLAAESPWIGQTVFFKDGATGKAGNRHIELDFTAIITKVEGKRLWVGETWVEEQDVLTVDQALVYYTTKIEDEPSPFHWFCRARAWSEKKEFDKAIADYTEVIRLDSEYAEAYFNRANARREKGDIDNAMKDYTEFIRLDPDDVDGYLSRALEWAKQEMYNKAIKDYTQAIRLDPIRSSSYLRRGAVWAEKERYDSAIKDFTEAIRLDPKDARGYYYRGRVWREKEDYQHALQDYNEAIRLNPEYINAHHGRAWLLATCPDARCRDGKQAVEDAIKACKSYAWKDVRGIGALAAAYAEAGDFKNAIKWGQKAIELDTEEEFPELKDYLELYESGQPLRDPAPK